MGANLDMFLPKRPGSVRAIITANRCSCTDIHNVMHDCNTAYQVVLYSANGCLLLSRV